MRHEPEVIEQLIAGLARSVAADVTYRTLAADVRAVAPAINVQTISNYVGLLQRLFVVEPQRPWTPKLRSRARLRTSPELHLVDASLAAAPLGAGSQQLRGDLKLPDGLWGAVEVKLGGAQMAAGVESLRKVIDQIDTDAVGEPAFRLVVTGTGPTLTADDGTVISSLIVLAP